MASFYLNQSTDRSEGEIAAKLASHIHSQNPIQSIELVSPQCMYLSHGSEVLRYCQTKQENTVGMTDVHDG